MRRPKNLPLGDETFFAWASMKGRQNFLTPGWEVIDLCPHIPECMPVLHRAVKLGTGVMPDKAGKLWSVTDAATGTRVCRMAHATPADAIEDARALLGVHTAEQYRAAAAALAPAQHRRTA